MSGGNEGLLFHRAFSSKVDGATHGGRVPFCASAMLSTNIPVVIWKVLHIFCHNDATISCCGTKNFVSLYCSFSFLTTI